MKNSMSLLLGVILGVAPLYAAETAKKDTTINFNKKTVYLEDSVGQLKVKVFDNDGTYKQVYEGIYSDGKSYEKWTVVEELGIQIPFMNRIHSKKKRTYNMDAHWAGIGWGFANITDASYRMNNVDGVWLKSESSNEFFWNMSEKILPIYRNCIGITTGLGISWHNYFLDMNTHLLEVNGITAVYPALAGINYEYSRLRAFQINVPLLLEWQPNLGRNHRLFVVGGVIGGLNASASYKVKYKDANGSTIKNVESKGLNVAPLSLDFMGQIGYNKWSVYAKYSPFSIFQSGKGPDIRAASLGLLLHF